MTSNKKDRATLKHGTLVAEGKRIGGARRPETIGGKMRDEDTQLI